MYLSSWWIHCACSVYSMKDNGEAKGSRTRTRWRTNKETKKIKQLNNENKIILACVVVKPDQSTASHWPTSLHFICLSAVFALSRDRARTKEQRWIWIHVYIHVGILLYLQRLKGRVTIKVIAIDKAFLLQDMFRRPDERRLGAGGCFTQTRGCKGGLALVSGCFPFIFSF